MIAARYLRAKRKESFISVISLFSLIGIALGVATLIIVMSVMNGFRVELLKSILGLSGHVTIQSETGNVFNYDAVVARILKVPGVVRATPIVDGQVLASWNNENTGVIVHGIRGADLAKVDELNGKLREGSLPNFQGDDALIVGSGLAAKLGLHVGGEVTLISPKGDVTPSAPHSGPRPITSSVSSMSATRFTTATTSSCHWTRRRPISTWATA